MAEACASLLHGMEQLRKVSAFAEAYRTEVRRGVMRSEEHRDQLAGFLQ